LGGTLSRELDKRTELMQIPIKMPRTAPHAETAAVARWLKAVGDRVERGEPLVEIQTDKVTLEIEASTSGILAQILCSAGEEVEGGQPIAYLEVEE
jgi:pyruvate/2-oxoglutarate dehydrogenase complex dihydrolipoamide acyltransferase (E2) component